MTMNALLVDLDGVLYKGDKVLPGAVESIAWLNENAVPHLFLTNTTSRPIAAIREKLQGFGINVDKDRILTPIVAARSWIKNNTDGRTALFVPAASRADFGDIPLLPDDQERDASCVVVGDLGESWDFQTLNRAFRLLVDDSKPALVALGMTRYWRAEDGLRLDVAPFIKALEHAAGCEAVVLGKPSGEFFNTALEKLGVTADGTLMIGDDIVGDIDGAQKNGINGILVKTGKFRESDLESGIKAHAVIGSVADLPGWWERNLE